MDAEPLLFVSGASGFIACHLIKLLQEQGYRVRGSVRSIKNEEKVAPLKELVPDAKYPLELVEADLEKPDSWIEAIRGCTYVFHMASPFPISGRIKNEEEVVRPAVDGTLNVLRACVEVGGVKRVVLTSSTASVFGGVDLPEGKTLNESDWTDTESPYVDAYYKSKVLAEKAAWDFLENLPEEKKFELAVVNPTLVIGPMLSPGNKSATSVEIIRQFLSKEFPAVPNFEMQLVDARDVALAHLRAMFTPEAAGHRHIVHTDCLTMSEVGQILYKEFNQYGYWVPTFQLPNIVCWFVGFVDAQMRNYVYPRLDLHLRIDNSRMKDVLKITPRDVRQAIIDEAHSLIQFGVVKKTKKYKEKHDQAARDDP
ncbi:unnamed protein product [Cyprideis torosa]|uniref:Uncharacterized protein n=1 Tax=Cyprideis torosa TaxID=163714 RepID=A0A7R8WAQ0_9CRUS|nr:unnamed protein product [Cyprideis torosa]CAG0891295.1 unnamed protein product [Cyprideis torosa]